VTDESSATGLPSTGTSEPTDRTVAACEEPRSTNVFTRYRWVTKTWSVVYCSAVVVADVVTRTWSSLSLFRVQAIVAVVTGLVTIAVGIHSLANSSGSTTGIGEVVTVVQDAASMKSVTDATIEILTPKNALVATLTLDSAGRARQTLREGRYVVSVKHPSYAPEVRKIQVFSKQTVEIKTSLRAGSGQQLDHVKGTVGDGVRAMRRALHF
jgi:multisubunit Na+/H+ antiporter MnhG subunit